MRKLFYLLLMLFIAYGCFVGYRMYKNRVDGMFVEKILKVNKNHYSKLEKISNEKYDIENKIASLKNAIEKNNKEISKTNEKIKDQEKIKEEEKIKNKANKNVENNNKKDLEAAPAIDVNNLKEKNKKLEEELKEYEKLVIEIKKVEEKLEKIASEFYSYLKKCQLNFISSKVKKDVSKFLLDYEEDESELNKTIEKVLNESKLLKEKYNPQEKEKKKEEVKKEEKKKDEVKKEDNKKEDNKNINK